MPLAILPAGTANVLAMEMRIGSKMERAAEMLEDCRPLPHLRGPSDVRRWQRFAVFPAHGGRGSGCAHRIQRERGRSRRAPGKLAYWLAGWRVLGRDLP